MPEPQPSDVGFGYVSETQASKHASMAEVPMTPNSPLKSALKTPGTGKENPLSPTFKEEEALEKAEEHTDKQNAKDLVCHDMTSCFTHTLIYCSENQNQSTNGQNVFARNKFQLQLDCAVIDLCDLHHFQCL